MLLAFLRPTYSGPGICGNEISAEYRRAFGVSDKYKPTSNFLEWVETSNLILDEREFSFHKHKYLREPYN